MVGLPEEVGEGEVEEALTVKVVEVTFTRLLNIIIMQVATLALLL